MPTVLRKKGLRFFFFSNEVNEPAHIHVESSDKYVKFWLEPLHIARSVGFNSRELSEIRKLIQDNMNVLKGKWDEYFSK